MRYAGGPNAGHTLVIGEDKLVFRLVPSGVLHAHTQCLLGQGMVLNPKVLLEELDTLGARGLDTMGRVHISGRAHLLLPYHVLIDGLREAAASTDRKIGTTKRGIGPCYEDKVGRRGLRMVDLRDLEHARRRIGDAISAWTPVIEALGGTVPDPDEIFQPLREQAQRLVPMLADTSERLDDLVNANKRVLLEGAQGTLLDIDHGTYPFVTSSSSIAGGACIGAGIGPTRLNRVIGITKAYTTRVGSGPFPTELHGDAGAHLRDKGGEFGSVTGRPRRTGWLDIAALRHAQRVNGIDGLALTKVDVLSGMAELQVCVGYDTPNGSTNVMPIDDLANAKPRYETLPGWQEDISDCRKFDELPANTQSYLRFIEEQTATPLDLVSVGPRRDETIVLRDSFDE